MAVTPRMLVNYRERVMPSMREQFGRENPMSLPRLTKVVVSIGLGKAVAESQNRVRENKRYQEAVDLLKLATGQTPKTTKARISVSNFKLRAGMDVGLMVTMRGARMYEFLDRLISVVLPRVRDFRGLNPNGFDGRGNYNFGLTEQSVFPEVNLDKVSYQQGMNITVVTTARNDAEARTLLTLFGMPFRT